MRLIDADVMRTDWLENGQNEYVYDTNAVLDSIDEQPTIDAEPVRHGRWVKCQGKSNIWYCSECGEKINYKQNRRTYNIPKVPVWQKNKRCRCCGAKMDGRHTE